MRLPIIIIVLAAISIMSAAGQYNAEYTAEYWSGLGDQQFLNDSFQEAAESYDKALNFDPNNTYLLINKGKSLANMGRYQDAIACFDESIAINSSSTESLHLKGIALSQGLNMNDEAIAVFEQALQLDSSNSAAWDGKGMALANKGDYTGSLACFQTATRIDPQNPVAWNNEGVVLRELGRYQEALDRFDKALLLDPDNEAAQKNRISTLEDMNRFIHLGKGQTASFAL